MKRIIALLIVFPLSSFLSAGTVPIGSAFSQGDCRIDNHLVRMSGTIFSGSVIETGNSAISRTDVRLNDNVRLTLHGDSLGTFYRDHLVLLHGEVEIAAASTFRTEAAGLIITNSESRTTGLISIGRNGVVNVSADAGSFRVETRGGILLAQVNSQTPQAIALQADKQWRTVSTSRENLKNDYYHRCYIDSADDRDCDHHHHRHASK